MEEKSKADKSFLLGLAIWNFAQQFLSLITIRWIKNFWDRSETGRIIPM